MVEDIKVLDSLIKESVEISGVKLKDSKFYNNPSFVIYNNYGDGGETPGLFNSSFRVDVLDPFESVKITDILVSNKGNYMYVKDKCCVGSNYCLNLKLVCLEPTKYIDPSEISMGSVIYKDLSVVSE